MSAKGLFKKYTVCADKRVVSVALEQQNRKANNNDRTGKVTRIHVRTDSHSHKSRLFFHTSNICTQSLIQADRKFIIAHIDTGRCTHLNNLSTIPKFHLPQALEGSKPRATDIEN